MIVPTHASLVARGTGRVVVPPAAIQQRTVVALHAPPPAPVPFAVQVKAIESNGGRPLTTQQVTSLRASTPAPARPSLHVVSAAAKPANGATLRPARQGLPEPVPAVGSGMVPRAVVVPPAAPARTTTETPAARPPVTVAETPTRPAAPAAETPARLAAPATETPARPAAPATETPARAAVPPPTSPEPARVTTEPVAQPAQSPVRAAAVGPSSPTPRAPAAYASPALTSSFAAQQAQLEARHVQEFAKPPAGESPQALSARQQTEHRTLEANYHQAAAAGRTSMPSPAPRPAAPTPRPPPSAPSPHR